VRLTAQPVGNQSATNGQGEYTPYLVRDKTAAERAEVAGRAYRTTMDGWVERAMARPAPGGGPPDLDALFGPELAEWLGQWSLRRRTTRRRAWPVDSRHCPIISAG
jgi:hypothetical protein